MKKKYNLPYKRKDLKLACMKNNCNLEEGHLGPCNDILEEVLGGKPSRNDAWKKRHSNDPRLVLKSATSDSGYSAELTPSQLQEAIEALYDLADDSGEVEDE